MSDHGFNTFRRGFNLNTWLVRERLSPARRRPWKQEESAYFDNTDWSKTRAYGMGLNGLYVNERGREGQGSVASGADKDNLVREIVRKLEALTDPATGERAVLRAFVARDDLPRPDTWSRPRTSSSGSTGATASPGKSPLGGFPREIFEDNTQKWSGDHMSAPEVLPGIVLRQPEDSRPRPRPFTT